MTHPMLERVARAICRGQCEAAAVDDARAAITATRPDKRRRDLDNLLKATLDALVKGGAIIDDSGVVDLRIHWIEEGPPGLCISITTATDLRAVT